jgi:hypothetical protein
LPVQNLVAGGFGTLEVTEVGRLQGQGAHNDGRWTVVFSRPFDPTGELQPVFDGGSPVDVAFAVWDGSKGERNGLKSVSSFTQLSITPEDPPRRAVSGSADWPAYTPPNPLLGVGVGFVVLLLAASAVGWVLLRRDRGGSDANEQ